MSRFKLHSFLVSASLLLVPTGSHAQVHKGISFQGVIKLPSGEYPTKSGLTVNSYILSSNNCILREEQFTGVNVSNGYINIPIGTGVVTGDDPGLTMKQIMDNSSPITQGPTKTSGLVCLDSNGNVNSSVTSFNPATGDGRRKFRLNVVIDGTPVVADFNMRSMAYAINAEASDDAKKLNGKADTSFIQTSTSTTQIAVDAWFASVAMGQLMSGTYNAPTATTATNLVGGINSLLPAQSGNTGKFLKTNGSSVSWADIPATATGLTQVGIDLPTSVFTNGADITANGKVSATFKSQIQKHVFAAPNAADGSPVFRQLLVSDISNAGTASLYNVPVTGNAGTTEVVKGDDSRLGDPRTPIDGSVTTVKIADGAVTNAKINTVDGSKITGTVPTGTLPVAGSGIPGIVSAMAQSFSGLKTFLNGLAVTGNISASGNITGSDLASTGSISAMGSVTSASLSASGEVSAASLKVTGGSPSSGKVLTSDASGNASWQTPASSGTKAYQAISSPYSILPADAGKLLEVTNGSAVTLPNAATVGAGFFVSIKRTGTSDVTINTTSAQTIDGQSSQTLQTQYSGLVLVSNGSQWIIESKYGLNPALLTINPGTITGLNATIPTNGSCQSVTVNNTGQIASSIITVTVPANFTKSGCSADTCNGNTLAGGASCTVSIAASGSAPAGSINGSLTIAATTGGTVQATLSGTITDPCPSNFILVPALSGYTASNFCVAKYEMRNNGSGVAISQSSGSPWVSIQRGANATTAGAAWKACKDMGANYDLISNAQWQTIARNIEGVASNWSGGSVGSGGLNRGHSDNAPANALTAAVDSDPCNGTGQTCSTSTWDSQRRTHNLSNGAVIWDFAGNVWEWVKDDNSVNFGANAYVSQITTASHTAVGTVTPGGAAKAVFGPAGDYTSLNSGEYGGLGYGYLNYSAGAVFRGGDWDNGTDTGVFAANLNYGPTNSNTSIGFRCVYQP